MVPKDGSQQVTSARGRSARNKNLVGEVRTDWGGKVRLVGENMKGKLRWEGGGWEGEPQTRGD